MIAAFARAARVLVAVAVGRALSRGRAGRPRRSSGRACGATADGRLLRRYRDGEAAIDGYAEDYAYLICGLLELFQADGDAAWLEWAIALQERQDALFWDDADGGWFSTTGTDPTVLLRLKEDYDGAEPAAGSLATHNLITLGHLVGGGDYLERAERTLARYGPRVGAAGACDPDDAGRALGLARRAHAGRDRRTAGGAVDARAARASWRSTIGRSR